MATIKQTLVLKHRANLGEEADEVEFQAGQEVTVLKEWAESALCKHDDGRLFNIPKPHLDLSG